MNPKLIDLTEQGNHHHIVKSKTAPVPETGVAQVSSIVSPFHHDPIVHERRDLVIHGTLHILIGGTEGVQVSATRQAPEHPVELLAKESGQDALRHAIEAIVRERVVQDETELVGSFKGGLHRRFPEQSGGHGEAEEGGGAA